MDWTKREEEVKPLRCYRCGEGEGRYLHKDHYLCENCILEDYEREIFLHLNEVKELEPEDHSIQQISAVVRKFSKLLNFK